MGLPLALAARPIRKCAERPYIQTNPEDIDQLRIHGNDTQEVGIPDSVNTERNIATLRSFPQSRRSPG